MCSYCEPSHKREMQQFSNRRIYKDRYNRNYKMRIGKSWKGTKYKQHRLMLFAHDLFVATIKINYCPFCGRKLYKGVKPHETLSD